MACRSSSRTCSSGTWRPWPALLTSPSTRPKRSRVVSTRRTICAGSRRSVGTARAPDSSSTRLSTRSTRRAASTTVAPRPAASRAVAAPMPDEAPVMMTTALSSSIPRSLPVGCPARSAGRHERAWQEGGGRATSGLSVSVPRHCSLSPRCGGPAAPLDRRLDEGRPPSPATIARSCGELGRRVPTARNP